MKCPHPRYIWPKGKILGVPCGKCLICLSNRRKDWAFRLMQEKKVSESGYFVTLTYKKNPVSLVKRHLQLYLKRLRKRSPRLRYYAVGEYGKVHHRPHYHAIIFNCNESDIRKAWTLEDEKGVPQELGIVDVKPVTEASVQYVLKYIVQKNEFPKDLAPSFAIMSRGYGLGLNYLTDNMVQWHRDDDRVYVNRYGEKSRLPRYYKEKIWPNSEWSDWSQRREKCFTKAQQEAEKKDKEENEKLKAHGIKDPEAYRTEMRNAEMRRIKTKVAFSQKL